MDASRAAIGTSLAVWTAIAALSSSACRFDFSLEGTEYRCSESGRCPQGMSCVAGVCLTGGELDASRPGRDGAPADAAPPDAAGCRAPSLDAVTTHTDGGPPSPAVSIGLDHAASGTDRLLIAVVSHRADAAQEVVDIAYGDAKLTRLCRASGSTGDAYVTDVWTLADPPEGTESMLAVFDESADSVLLAAISFTGVDTLDPIADFECAEGAGAGEQADTALEASLSSSPCHLVFGAGTTYSDDPAPGDGINELTPYAGVTEHWRYPTFVSPWNTVGVGGSRPGETDVTIGWTAERNWPRSLVAVSLQGL